MKLTCGGIGIRTLGTREGSTVFKTVPFNHSGIPPDLYIEARLRMTTGGLRHAVATLQRGEGGEGGIRTLGSR
jgi:hypothetical protein